MSKAAPEVKLQELHALVADTLKDAIKNPPVDDEGNEKLPLSAIGMAIKFLKDNGIQPAKDVDNKALRDLSEQVDQIIESGDTDRLKEITQ